jgi:MoaA/NifB/PqqE/SkfB family radical SAM enzyme
MTNITRKHFQKVLAHLYINPLEKCNLACKICYTRKTGPILTMEEILKFIDRYQQTQKLETVTFCGGEVLALSYFPELVNRLTNQGLFVRMITNGTIDCLEKFTKPNSINLIVSLDGLPNYHDRNRGEGNFDVSVAFIKKAMAIGFHSEIFSIVTKQNLTKIDEFESFLKLQLGETPFITYHPRKPPSYLMSHPVSNIIGDTDGFDFLDTKEMLTLMKTKNVFPPKDLGCYQIAVASNGSVFGCCEGTTKLGNMTDDIPILIGKLEERIELWEKTNKLTSCLGCSQSEFMCGIKEYLKLI